jgi:uncharacterized protein YdaU (DUF1376 family)
MLRITFTRRRKVAGVFVGRQRFCDSYMPEKHEPLSYYKWFVRDYRANRKVQRMSYVARGLYRDLLDEQWLDGSLPEDLTALADICGCSVKVMEKYWPEIAPCFDLVDGRLINPKLETMRTEQDKVRIKRVESGRLGGMAKQTQANAKHMLEAPKQVAEGSKQLTYRREEQSSSTLLAGANEESISPEMVAKGVLETLGLSGGDLLVILTEVSKSELSKGTGASALRDRLVASWLEFSEAKGQGKLTQYAPGARSFFGEGGWKDRTGWRWKEGHEPSSRPLEPAKPAFERPGREIPMSEIRAEAMTKAGI